MNIACSDFLTLKTQCKVFFKELFSNDVELLSLLFLSK